MIKFYLTIVISYIIPEWLDNIRERYIELSWIHSNFGSKTYSVSNLAPNFIINLVCSQVSRQWKVSVVNGISKSWLEEEFIPKLKIHFEKVDTPIATRFVHYQIHFLSPECSFLTGSSTKVVKKWHRKSVTENITKQGPGSNICPVKYNLSMKYILASVKAIGRFHTNGYIF